MFLLFSIISSDYTIQYVNSLDSDYFEIIETLKNVYMTKYVNNLTIEQYDSLTSKNKRIIYDDELLEILQEAFGIIMSKL